MRPGEQFEADFYEYIKKNDHQENLSTAEKMTIQDILIKELVVDNVRAHMVSNGTLQPIEDDTYMFYLPLLN